MRTRVAVLLVDALGWTLAERERFAPALTHRRRLETVLGFSSGALPTLFTGRPPCEHGRFLMFRRAGRGGAFRGFGALALLPARLRRSWKLSRLLARLVRARGVEGYFQLYEVPRHRLARFDLAERDDIFRPGGLPLPSLWDALERAGVRWRGWNWRTPEPEALDAAARALAADQADFVFVYTAALDAELHREGSHGASVRARLAGYEAWLGRLEREARERGESLALHVLSDHGMVDVTRTVDVPAALARLGAREGRDYLLFLDSTFARFWWHSASARDEVRAALAALPGGRWLDDAGLAARGALFPGRDYGDDLWLLDPGVLAVPSYMGLEPVRAMHGYDPSHPDMAAVLLSNRPQPAGLDSLLGVRAFLEAEAFRTRERAA